MEKSDESPRTTNPPERFEEHWQEHKNSGWWLLPALCGGAVVWIIIAWIIVVRYMN